MEVLSGDIHGTAVTEMAAMSQIHAQDGIAGLCQGEEGGQIGVGAGVGLDIGEVAAEELTGTLAGDLLGDVHGVAAAVITLAGIAFGVFVGEAGAHGQHNSLADNVFGGDQFDIAALTGKFLLNGCPHFGIQPGEVLHSLLNHGTFLLIRIVNETVNTIRVTKTQGHVKIRRGITLTKISPKRRWNLTIPANCVTPAGRGCRPHRGPAPSTPREWDNHGAPAGSPPE